MGRGQQNLFKMNLDGSKIEQLTGHENPVWSGGSFSPDGSVLAYTNNEEGDLNNTDIYLVSSDGNEVNRVVQTKVGSHDGFGSWAADSSFFSFTTLSRRF